MSRIARSPQLTWTAVVAGYLAVVLLMLAPRENYGFFSSAIVSGDPKLLAWTFAWTNHAILTGAPLFDANVFYPAKPAFAFIEHHVGVGLWGLPLFALTHNAVLVYSFLQILALVANGIAMHVFAWRWLRSHSAALVGGLVFAVSSSRLLYSGHVPIVWNCWLPLLLIAADRWMTHGRWKWALMSATLFSLQALATWYLAVMAAIVVAVFVPWRLLWHFVWKPPASDDTRDDGRGDRQRRVLALALQATAALVLVALVVWPFARPYMALKDQEVVAPALAQRYAADWGSYVQPHASALLGGFITRTTGLKTRSAVGERAQFVGFLTIGVGLIGAVRWLLLALGSRQGDKHRDVLWSGFFVLLGAVATGLSFGPSSEGSGWMPFDLILRTPGLNMFRVPSRFAVLVTFAAAGLAASGFASIIGRVRRGRLAALALIPPMLLEWAIAPALESKPKPEATPRIYEVVAGLDVHALVSLPCYRRTASSPLDADYMLYSTRHWHPIVNGYGRVEPRALLRVVGTVNAFPGRNAAVRMRELGIDYVVVHSARFPDRATALLQQALASDDFRLVAQMDGDYLFQVMPQKAQEVAYTAGWRLVRLVRFGCGR